MAETQADYFIQIKGKSKTGEVKGESEKGAKEGWILVNGFSWGASQTGITHAGSLQTGAATFGTFNFSINLQGASPKLHQMLATNEGLDLEFIARAGTGSDPEDYYSLKFTDARMVSYDLSGTGFGVMPTENYKIAYMTVEETYKGKKGDQSHNTNIGFIHNIAKGL